MAQCAHRDFVLAGSPRNKPSEWRSMVRKFHCMICGQFFYMGSDSKKAKKAFFHVPEQILQVNIFRFAFMDRGLVPTDNFVKNDDGIINTNEIELMKEHVQQ